MGGTEDNASDDELSTDVSVGSDESTDGEVVSGRRQRRRVDYKKLYDVSTQPKFFELFFFLFPEK